MLGRGRGRAAELEQENQEEEEESLLEAFRIFDRSNKGYIGRTDIERVVRLIGERLTDDEIAVSSTPLGRDATLALTVVKGRMGGGCRVVIQAMLAEADTDNDGRVSFIEFCAIVQAEEEGGAPRAPPPRTVEHPTHTCRKYGVDFSDAPVVYTDGACSRNGRCNSRAGYGVYWGSESTDNEYGPVHGEQTNNRAELLAVIHAINKAISKGMMKLVVRTDSQLLINSMDKWIEKWKMKEWKTADKKDVKNKDLLMTLDSLLDMIPVKFEHVRGHAGIHGNEMADQLARKGAEEAGKNMYGGQGLVSL